MNKKGVYILFLVYAVLAASVFAYYMLNPVVIDSVHTKELTVTHMEFTTSNDSDVIVLYARNSGKFSVTVDAAKINGDLITGDSIHSLTIEPNDSGTITIKHDWTTANTYTINMFTADGQMVSSYTDTA
jgi:hypothetical protein